MLMLFRKVCCFVISALVSISSSSFADDTELYVYESSARTGERPQVLIIFDTSGSMTEEEEGSPTFYPRGESLGSDTKIFYTKNAAVVPDLNSKQYILNNVNACNVSKKYLKNYGMFTGFVREYSFLGESGTWRELPTDSGESISLLDCFDDIENKDITNLVGGDLGIPVDNEGNKNSIKPYTVLTIDSSVEEENLALEKAKLTKFGTGQPFTLFTEKYVAWYHGDNGKEDYTRMQIAQRVIEDTIITTPSVDFGIVAFNKNTSDTGRRSNNGGRVVAGIEPSSDSITQTLLNIVGGLKPKSNTPLCETFYESYLYFAGMPLHFAKQNRNERLEPHKDTSIENYGSYISPFEGKKCQNNAFVVYITDGEPTRDSQADGLVKALSGVSADDKYKSSYLAALAGWMNKNDVNKNIADVQTVTTFTIGFSQGASSTTALLRETAKRGGGKYFHAKDAAELQSALQNVFSNIMAVNSSFTSPSIASNNFDRIQTDDSVYYAMFLPNKGPRWAGNLKKFKVNTQGNIVDDKGDLVINTNGDIDKTACSIWSDCSNGADGNEVLLGGVAQALTQTANRKFVSNFVSKGILEELTVSSAASFSGSEQALATYMKVDINNLESSFKWAKGIDVDDDDGDNSTTDMRVDIIGDPLHSKPLALNFGTQKNPDIRILMGTNHGVLHMFKDAGNSVSEIWAFMPYEFLPHLKDLRSNVPTGVHSVYGLDSSPVAHITYKLNSHNEKEVDKAWLFIGMRRGGTSHYALDISIPDKPKLLWKIDASSTGMEELGQSWSEPVITSIPGYVDNTSNKPKPVLVFGGGYSRTKDGAAVGQPDPIGKAVFILDAKTGKLIHKFDPAGGVNATQIKGIQDSIPNKVAILDSNNDGLTDRIYATDTGANIWRMDLPSADKKTWSAFKFAALGGDTVETDIRFFAEPVVAKTTVNGIPYDAVAVGTGHRAHPLNLERKDMFFMLQDKNVVTKSYNTNPPPTITLNKLQDISLTSNVAIPENTQNGWVYKFKTQGEKSLSAASIVKGRVFFTSYVPGDTSTSSNQCLAQGEGRLFGFDLHSGKRDFVEKGQDHENPQKDYISVGSRVPDTPQVVIPNGDKIYLVGIGNAGEIMEKVDKGDGCNPDDNKCIGGGLSTNKIYHYIHENQE